jgi:methionyl-tRNA formyltransferase
LSLKNKNTLFILKLLYGRLVKQLKACFSAGPMYFKHVLNVKEKCTMNVVFMGSAEFGIPTLEKLCASEHKIIGIVSTPSRKKGRGLVHDDSPVVHYARKKNLGVPILLPEVLKSEEFIDALKKLEADVFVVVAFRILPQSVFKLPRLGTVNIHASLLPLYRGPAPIQRAIAAGEKETGITIFRIDEGIDTGNIILQRSVIIGNEETTTELNDRLALLGSENLIEALSILEKGAALKKQDTSLASAAPKLAKAEGRINWNRPARVIFNMIRAFKPFPGAYAFLEGVRLNIEQVKPLDVSGSDVPGAICSVAADSFDVQCLNSRLRILEVKPEGKKAMSAKAFMLGRKITAGMRFQ